MDRNTSDSILYDICFIPNKLADILLKAFRSEAGQFKFFLVARTLSSKGVPYECLAGALFCVETSRTKMSELVDICEYISENHNAPATEERKFLDLRNKVHEYIRIGSKQSDLFCLFRLSRTGAVQLRHIDSLPQNPDKPEFPDDKNIRPKAIRDASSQLFFFLKDISHQHYHHSSTGDTVVDIHEDKDGETWLRETLYGLYRKVITLRRQGNADSLIRARGVLSYAQIFQKLFETKRAVGIDYFSKHINDSMESKLDQDQLQTQKRIGLFSSLFANFFGFSSFLIGIIALLSLTDKKSLSIETNPALENFAQWAISYPSLFAGALLASAMVLTISTGLWQGTNFQFLRTMARILWPWPKIVQWLIPGVLGIGLGFIAYTVAMIDHAALIEAAQTIIALTAQLYSSN